MPYTIVLTPPPEQAAKYVEVSQTLYSHYQQLMKKDVVFVKHLAQINSGSALTPEALMTAALNNFSGIRLKKNSTR